MKYLWTLVFAFGFLGNAQAANDEQAEAAALRLLDVMNMDAILKGTMDVALEAQLSQNPEVAPYRHVFQAFFAKHMSYEALKPKLAAIYAAEFSAAELDEAAAFYATPSGKKFLEKTPALMQKGSDVAQEAIAAHIPELQLAIKEESLRLQKLQEADAQKSGADGD